jgi:hypothetical protein
VPGPGLNPRTAKKEEKRKKKIKKKKTFREMLKRIRI